jgi:hypothetical protein
LLFLHRAGGVRMPETNDLLLPIVKDAIGSWSMARSTC